MNVYLLNLAIVLLTSELLKKKVIKVNFLFFLGIYFAFFLGLRHEIGTDWGGYSLDYGFFQGKSIGQLGNEIFKQDPLYLFINYLSIFLKADIYLVNLIVSSIFIFSFFKWIKNEKNINIYLVLFFSLYFIPLGASFVRQGLAISFFLIALNYWKLNNKLYILFLIFSFLSHKFAIIYFFIFFINPRGKLFNLTNIFLIIFFVIIYILFITLFSSHGLFGKNNLLIVLQDFFLRYKDLSSISSTFRLGIGLISSFLFFQHLFVFKERSDFRYLTFVSFLNILFFLIHLKYSTIADRFGLYMIPFNLIVLSNFYERYNDDIKNVFKYTIYLVSIFYLILLTNFSPQKHLISPYKTFDPHTYKSYKARLYLQRKHLISSDGPKIYVPEKIIKLDFREFYISNLKGLEKKL